MKVVVVGGAGFIGSHLVDRLLAEGFNVDAVDDLSTGSLANLAEARTQSGGGQFKFHNLDVTDGNFTDLVALRRPDVIFHLAALAPGRPQPEAVVASTLSVLDAARINAVAKIVMALPGAALYGELSARELPAKEDRGWSPHGVVGVVARAAAELLEVYRNEHALEFTALALANVYGPRQRPNDGVVAAFNAAAAAGEPAVLHGDGRQTRDFVYIDDTVDAFVHAAQRGSGLVVNVGTGVQTSIRDLWTAVSGGAPSVAASRRQGDITRSAMSPLRARIHLSWEPWTTLDQGLAQLRRAH